MAEFQCKSRGHTERWGLYLMVFIILLKSCSTHDRTEKLEEKLDNLASKVESIRRQTKPLE